MALPEEPLSRNEQYLNRIATGECELPEMPLSRIEQYLDYIAEHGAGGGEPAAYIKNAAVSEDGNTLTLTKKDDTTVEFAPETGASAAEDVTYDPTTSGLDADNVQDAIDELAEEKADISIIAAEYNPTSTYGIHSCVIHDGKLYRSIATIATPEEWNSSHWQAIRVSNANSYIIRDNLGNGLIIGSGTVASNQYWQTAIGIDVKTTQSRSTVIGNDAQSTGLAGIVIGANSKVTASHAIQIGAFGTNSEANTVKFSNNNNNWKLLDLNTGLIPFARMNNIKSALDAVAVPGAQYFLGEQSAVALVLPTPSTPAAAGDPEVGQQVSVVFYSGATAATLTVTGDVLGDVPTPAANQRIELNALWDGTYWALVNNVLAVPVEETV